MKKIFKIIGILILLAILIIAAIISYQFYLSNYWDNQESLVSMTIDYSKSECHEKRPLKIVVTNKSDNVVNEIKWDIGVFNKGYSTDLVQSGYHEYSHDKILNKNESWSYCYAIPKTDGAIRVETFKDKGVYSRLIYTIKRKYILFDK